MHYDLNLSLALSVSIDLWFIKFKKIQNVVFGLLYFQSPQVIVVVVVFFICSSKIPIQRAQALGSTAKID
jgi:hypothetical protein